MTIETIFEALAKEKPPCNGCDKYKICADLELACTQFHSFIYSGSFKVTTPRYPSRKIYHAVFFAADDEDPVL